MYDFLSNGAVIKVQKLVIYSLKFALLSRVLLHFMPITIPSYWVDATIPISPC
jgi:hypothetical protein